MAAQITALPTPPTRQDPTNFNDRADAFLAALPGFQSEANALSTEVNTRADNVQASDLAVLAATNITKWVSGTTYAQGAVVWSPINGLGYRRITASGSGTTDPSSDSTNYRQVNGTGNVSTDVNGNLGLGDTVNPYAGRLNVFSSDGAAGVFRSSTGSGVLRAIGAGDSYGGGEILTLGCEGTDFNAVMFRSDINGVNSVAGSINCGLSVTAYNTSSDYRLKHDIAPMQNALQRVAALKPVTYKWNADNSTGEGFIAHELQAVCPDAVTGEKDAVDDDGKPVYQGIDTSFLVATLVAAIQEQQLMITDLTSRIEALESALPK